MTSFASSLLVVAGAATAATTAWRAGHQWFWQSAQVCEELKEPIFTLDDGALVVAQDCRMAQAWMGHNG